jgi:hypothetical protein
MVKHLTPCPVCRRHVRVTETECPFCAVALDLSHVPPPVLPPRRLGRAAQLAFGASLAGALAGACDGESSVVRDDAPSAGEGQGGSAGSGGKAASGGAGGRGGSGGASGRGGAGNDAGRGGAGGSGGDQGGSTTGGGSGNGGFEEFGGTGPEYGGAPADGGDDNFGGYGPEYGAPPG